VSVSIAIDRASRDQLAELLRQLAAGEINSDEFRNRQPRSNDLAVREVIEQTWLLCRDLPEQKASGRKRLRRHFRGEVSRWILFLETDRQYEWPALATWARVLGFIPSVITFGLFWSPYRFWFKRQGDFRVWPFVDDQQFRAAKAKAGHRSGAA
jgi:hypothetical protein